MLTKGCYLTTLAFATLGAFAFLFSIDPLVGIYNLEPLHHLMAIVIVAAAALILFLKLGRSKLPALPVAAILVALMSAATIGWALLATRDVTILETLFPALASIAVVLRTRSTEQSSPLIALTAALIISCALLALAQTIVEGGLAQARLGVSVSISVLYLILGIGLLHETMRGAVDGLEAAGAWRRIELRAISALMIAPALVMIAGRLVAPDAPLFAADISGMFMNTLIVGSVLLWGLTTLTRERSETRTFAATFDVAPMAIVDADGVIVHWSGGCERLYGIPATTAVGQRKYALLRTQDEQGASAVFTTHPSTAEGLRVRETGGDGRQLDLIEVQHPVAVGAGPDLFVLSMTDISEVVNARQAARESEDRLVMAVEAHRIGIFEWNVKSDRIDWFADSESLLGLPLGSAGDYKSWSRHILPDDLKAMNNRIEAVRWSRAERFSFAYRAISEQGDIRAIEGSSRCFYDAQGELERTIGVNIDVTERMQQNAQLAAREAQLRSVLETVPSAMIVIDEAGTVLTFSRAAERLFGYTEDQVVGRNVAMLMTGEHATHHDGYLARYAQTGERRVMGTTRILNARHADGQDIPIELNVGEARFNDTRVFTGFISDISSRLRSEEQLQSLSDELTHVGRINAMGELAAALAHEINQPLAAVANHAATAETILTGTGDLGRAAEQLGAIRQQALRAGEIIRRLRDFVARRQVDARIEPVEATIKEASALVLVGHQRVTTPIMYDIARDAQRMFADKIQIQQVLVNLLRNAIEAFKMMPGGDHLVRITARRIDPDWIEIAMSDNGPGLPPSILEDMFKPFNSTKGAGGMGIGLLISRRIIEAHGGNLSASNNAEGGATFRFTVPSADSNGEASL